VCVSIPARVFSLLRQQESTPDPITGLATTGRGEGNSSIWVTQRLATLESTVVSQATSRLLGGFSDSNDLDRLRGNLDYPVEAHRPGGHSVPDLPESLHADDEGAISVRKWEDRHDGERIVTGSEWLYSDDAGEMWRRNTANIEMKSTHYGAPGRTIDFPGTDG